MNQLGDFMKQLQGMQGEMQKAQEELLKREVTGEAGGGLVKVTMNGKYRVSRIEIDDSLVGDDKDMLEDLVAAAINAASDSIAATLQDGMSGALSGAMPAGFKMPF